MKHFWGFLWGLFLLLGVLLWPRQPVFAVQHKPDPATLVTIHPAAATNAAGETILVEVWVENVLDLYGADIQLIFDPSAFRVLDADPNLAGVQVKLRSDLLKPGFVIHREADNQAGTIWYANSQVNPTPPVSGSGPIFEFSLLLLKNGDFPLTIASQQLSDKSGTPILAETHNAIYTVQGYKHYLPFIQRQPG